MVANSTPPSAEEIDRAIGKLISLRDGDMGVVDVAACGKRAIPALRSILFAREPSGLYEPRRRAVEALARLGARDVLIEFLSASRMITDPVERTGEDAVINAAARAIAASPDDRVIPLLLDLAERRPLAGIIEALGELRCQAAVPSIIKGLEEDFTRHAAEQALRRLRRPARAALLEAAIRRLPSEARESVSSKRRRCSALGLIAEFGPLGKKTWLPLRPLMRDEDPAIAAIACRICLSMASNDEKAAAIWRLTNLLATADWLLSGEIEDCLVTHFDFAEKIVGELLSRADAISEAGSHRLPLTRALRRVINRAR